MMDDLGDELVDDLVTQGHSTFLRTIFQEVIGFPDKIKKSNQKNDYFGLQAKQYADKLQKSIGSIRIIGMNEPVPLKNLYIKVRMLSKQARQASLTHEQLEEYFIANGARFGSSTETRLGMDVIKSEHYVAVLGQPGSGKTTFLKYIALSCLTNKDGIDKIPVFISLKQYADQSDALLRYIVNQFDVCGFPNAREYIEKMLKKGSLIIMFDGLDEVEKNQTKIIDDVEKFITKWNKCKYILSCRTAAYNYIFRQFVDVEIADFGEEQINAFTEKWFNNDIRKQRDFINELYHQDNVSILELAKSPLLLTLLCIAYDDDMSFPTSREELYRHAVDVLICKWDSSRSIKRHQIYKSLSPHKKKKLLEYLAYSTFTRNRYFFKKSEAEQYISDILTKMGSVIEDAGFDPQPVLDSIESQHGLIVQRARNFYSFSHLTFHEYFTACYVCQNTNITLRSQIIKQWMFEERWREVFLLVTSLLDDASSFLRNMLKEIQDLNLDPRVIEIMDRLNASINTTKEYPVPIKRAIALNTVLERAESLRPDRNLTKLIRASESLVKRLVELYKSMNNLNIEVASLRTLQLGINEHRENVDYISHLISGLDVTYHSQLTDYITASKLLIDCMSTDAIVDVKTKSHLVDSFLLKKT